MPASHGRVEGELKEVLPMGRRVLVIPHETATYKGSLIIPDSVKSVIPTTGVIKALGFDITEDTSPLQVGDRIIYSKYGGVEVTFDDGHRVLIVHEDDILGILGSAIELMGGEPVAAS